MTTANRQITLAARPEGFPKDSDFKLVETQLAAPGEDEFLVQAHYLSVDPYMRGRMNDAASYAEPVGIGDVMVGESVGKVILSNNEKYPEGTYVAGMFGWQEYAITDGKGVRKIDPELAPITKYLHLLGMPGWTAYFGLLDVCELKEGDNVLVSGAAGAVGSIVGQIAKLKGCRVAGIAGSDEKIAYLKDELGYDAAFNYKSTENLGKSIREVCPDGIDVYFDNVGGPITDAAFWSLNVGARIGICGQISQYNLEKGEQGPRPFWHLIVKRATVRGFLVFDFFPRFREATADLAKWYQSGQLKCEERITDGLENAPQAFVEMMQGANTGKQLVKIHPDA
ncbi:MAG: NADP-dependent oxidoreductase [Planctomycetaceae bacterium]|nr:NADP-dependent oxidoreductase [Planctomycetaceae bacterium]